MAELLAPAGNMEALKAAVSSGCDAIYLGMKKFGARAYSSNFDMDELEEAVTYAHLRNVKIYVTMNTIVFEDEIQDMKEQLDRLNHLGVDGIIVQDLAVYDYIVRNFVDMEVHCSTQMGIDDLDGALLFKELDAKRIVLAREVPIEEVKRIRKTAKIPVEVFVHGALCISYSGNCLMSGLIGYRSGNRGRCVGSCRKTYELIDAKTGESLGKSFILSTKDLKTIDHIEELKEIDSLKIEGRMREPAYVGNVVSIYREALDGKATKEQKDNLKKTFNRTFTKGYMFHEDPGDITNIQKPNNYGFEIGRVSGFHKGMTEITIDQILNQNDIIRIEHNNEDVNVSLIKLYDREGNLINKAEKVCYIKIKEKVSAGDIVYKTKDYLYYKELELLPEKEYRRFELDFKVYAYPEAKLVIEARGLGQRYLYEGDETLSAAINNPTTKEQVVKQLSKLNDTIFQIGNVEFEECNAFVPVKLLNNARREIVQALYDLRLQSKQRRTKEEVEREKISFAQKPPRITAAVATDEQYRACMDSGIQEIYYENIIRRNQNDYEPREGELLIGGYGGIHHYRGINPFVTDYSLNVVNSEACYELYRLGARRVTLSYELNKTQIKDLITAYLKENDGYPALEMIVYGRAPLMFTKYCPLKKLGQCCFCKKRSYELVDEYGQFPIISHPDCTTTILNGKVLNLLDEMPSIDGVEAFRLSFTTESPEETARVCRDALDKLSGSTKPLFNQRTDTRGHFNKEIL